MNETIRLILIFGSVAFVVLIIANIELFINEKKAIYSNDLVKTVMMIPPRKTGLNDPIWIFNSKNIKSKDIQYPQGHNHSLYQKYKMDEHLASKMNRPIKEFFSYLANIPKSSMPINNLFKSVSKGEEAIFTVDPSTSDISTQYKIIHSNRDKIESFISGDKFYIINKN